MSNVTASQGITAFNGIYDGTMAALGVGMKAIPQTRFIGTAVMTDLFPENVPILR